MNVPQPSPREIHLVGALKAFSRPSSIDAAVYERALARRRARQVIELGAGAGRLTARLLRWGYTVTAIERDSSLRAYLSRVFTKAHQERRVFIVPTLRSTHVCSDAMLVAPYNVAYYYQSPQAFARDVAGLLSRGVTAAVFDVDDLRAADIRVGQQRRTRCGFGEETHAFDGGQVQVRWYAIDDSWEETFSLRLSPTSGVIAALQEAMPRATIARLPVPRRHAARQPAFFEVTENA